MYYFDNLHVFVITLFCVVIIVTLSNFLSLFVADKVLYSLSVQCLVSSPAPLCPKLSSLFTLPTSVSTVCLLPCGKLFLIITYVVTHA